MAQVGDSAHTPHGLGQITEVLKERGRSSFRVAGRGFDVWVDETRLHVAGLESTIDPGGSTVNERNHTTLPYDPTPQYHADLFRQDQNIQPGENEIDADERLHPSDSLSGNSRTDVRGPQPSSGLFAPVGGENPFADERTSAYHDAGGHSNLYMRPQVGQGRHRAPEEQEGPRHAKPSTRMVPMGEEEYQAYMADDPRTSGGRHETWPMPRGEGGPGHYPSGGNFRPAGLSDRYAYFDLEATDHDSPVAQFRRDPVGYIRTCGHLWTDGDDGLEKYADYTQLIDVDPSMREAAWTDVRRKAMRLRHEGKVQVNDHGSGRIYATVEGDNGTYDVMIVKGGSYGGLGGGQSVTDWACSCPWGRWAFKRQMSYVGRLCSHGYAAYLEMQRRDIGPEHFQKKTAGVVEDYKEWLDENDQVPEAASIASYLNTTALNLSDDDVHELYDYAEDNYAKSPERDFKTPYTNDPEVAYKEADLLRTRPRGLTPDLQAVPEGEGEVWMDVEKDDRETTGPDQIVHFSSHDTLRRLHAQPTGTGSGGVPVPDQSTNGPMEGPGTGTGGVAGVAPPVQPVPGVNNPVVPRAANYTNILAALHTAVDDETATGGPFGKGWGIFDPRNWGGPGEPTYQRAPGTKEEKSGYGGGGAMVEAPDTTPDAPDTTPDAPDATPNVSDTTPNAPNTAPGREPGWGGPGAPALPAPAPAPPGPAPAPGAPGGGPGPDRSGKDWIANPGLDPEGKNAINDNEYQVQTGDTLNTILERAYGKDNVSGKMDEVVKANDIKNPDLIYAGDTMKLPGANQVDSLTGQPGAPVEPGAAATPEGTPPAAPGQTTNLAPGPHPELPQSGHGSGLEPNAPAAQPGSTGTNQAAPALAPTQPAETSAVEEQLGGQFLSSRGFRRFAESSDSALLDKLREMSSTPAADDLGHMESRNDELRDVVDELNDRGYDASFMVASLHDAERHEMDPTDADPSFLGLSGPDWADMGTEGSGPTPKDWISDSAGYVEEHELPHHEKDWADEPDGDIIKFNDGRSKPQQGPRSSAIMASLHYADAGEDEEAQGTGMFNPDNPDEGDWVEEHGKPMLDQLQQVGGQLGGVDAALALVTKRAGRGPVNPPRIDPGFRQPDRPQRYAAAPPEDFGYDGGADEVSYQDTPDGGGDIVAAFQRSAGAAAVMSENRASSNDDIAAHAQAFLRTAGRKYTDEEQRELEAEFHPQGARNLPTDDELEGTHYLLGL